jgi:hypothetical protein
MVAMRLISGGCRCRLTIGLLLSLIVGSLYVPSTNAKAALSQCEEGPIAQRYALCYFAHTVNDSLSLNATIWFQRPFNISGWWAEYGNLTWAFDPNLAFWAYFQDELARITAVVSSKIAVESVRWGFPLRDDLHPDSNDPAGDIIDYNNGSYRPTIFYIYPAPLDNPAALVTNLTFALGIPGVQVLPSEYWHARVYWDMTLLSEAQWTPLAEQLSDKLNATWYMKACIFDIVYAECNGTAWPFETVFLGFFILVGLTGKGRLSTRKRVS